MERVLKRVVSPFVGVAMVVYIPVRAWRRAKRSGISAEEAFRAMSEDAWAKMSPQMKAEIDPDRAQREASGSRDIANPS